MHLEEAGAELPLREMIFPRVPVLAIERCLGQPNNNYPISKRKVTFKDTTDKVTSLKTRLTKKARKQILSEQQELEQIITDNNTMAIELRRMAWSMEHNNTALQARVDYLKNFYMAERECGERSPCKTSATSHSK